MGPKPASSQPARWQLQIINYELQTALALQNIVAGICGRYPAADPPGWNLELFPLRPMAG